MAKKKATSGKRADKMVAVVTALLSKTPVNKEQVIALKKLGKSLAVFERSEAAVAKAQEKADVNREKAKIAADNFKKKKTRVARRAVERVRGSASAAVAALSAAKLKSRENAAQLKEDMAVVSQADKKEVAKNKAVATFTALWEKRYDRMVARKAKKQADRKKASLRKKRGVKSAKPSSDTGNTPVKSPRTVKAKTAKVAKTKKIVRTTKAKTRATRTIKARAKK